MKKVNEKMTVEIPGHKYNIHIKKGVLADVHKYVDLERKVLIVKIGRAHV